MASDPRNNDLAKIHIAKKQLQLDDDTYRDILWTVARVKSARDLDYAGRWKVLNHFRSLGFRAQKTFPGRPHNIETDAQLKKIEALLTDMRLPWSYADSIAKQMFKIPRVGWLRAEDQKSAVINALIARQEKVQSDKAP